MKLIIDRFEGNYAICEGEDGKMIQLEIDRLPVGARELSALHVDDNKILLDEAKTALRHERIKKMMKGLWE